MLGGGGGGLDFAAIGGSSAGIGGGATGMPANTLPFFASGGSMTLGGFGGVDRNLLSLNGAPIARVSKGEELNVTPSGGSGSDRPIVVQMNINGVRDADSFNRNRDQILARTQAELNRANRRNG
jgi:hypothetical protein